MPLLLSARDVESVLTMKDCLSAVELAFAELARGRAVLPQRAAIRIPDHNGLFLGMPASIGGEVNALGFKAVTVYPDNPARHALPTTLGTLLLCDPATGKAIAIMDAGLLTAMRTGAASGVATKHLARKAARRCVIFGAGVQGRRQVEAVHLVRPLERLDVVDVDAARRDRFVHDVRERLGLNAFPATDASSAVRAADIVITATSSREPVFDGDWLRPGAHVNNIGSHSPDARELDTRTIVRSKFVADLKEATLAEAGDILIPIREGAVGPDHIHASLGEIILGAKPGRESDEEITVFKSNGLAIQDMATAAAVYASARRKGIGTEIEL